MAQSIEAPQDLADYPAIVDTISSWLPTPAEKVDQSLGEVGRVRAVTAVRALNTAALTDPSAFFWQQKLLARIYDLTTQIPDGPTAEGSVALHEVTRLLEVATIEEEDRHIPDGLLEQAPSDGKAYLSWLKKAARQHRVFKHPYYREFIQHQAGPEDLRTYILQESVVDGRFDDLLAMMQIGTSGPAKMEIATNFWDEMGNGNPDEVHTHLFNKIFDVFEITQEELDRVLTANALLSGNLAVLLCRYRQYYPEAVGFLGMTEWLVPDRFKSVVSAWQRLGLPDIGIVYHKLHITIDSVHAAGWFHNIVAPSAGSEAMRRGIARGAIWRLNSSARYLDERMASSVSSV
jgi:hypothetical protein